MKTVMLTAAAALALSSTAAVAGGLAPAVIEAPVVVVDTPAPAASSLPGYVIPLALLAALAAAAAAESDSDSD